MINCFQNFKLFLRPKQDLRVALQENYSEQKPKLENFINLCRAFCDNKRSLCLIVQGSYLEWLTSIGVSSGSLYIRFLEHVHTLRNIDPQAPTSLKVTHDYVNAQTNKVNREAVTAKFWLCWRHSVYAAKIDIGWGQRKAGIRKSIGE